jgi:predicted nucleotide-binding protein (sugar kinase/HSP70/actin superfamily)
LKLAESLILESPEQEAQMYADLFPEIHPNIKVEEEKIKQAWLDGYNNRKQFEKKNNERDNG